MQPTYLDLSGRELTDFDLGRILTRDDLSFVTDLDLSDNDLTSEGFRLLWESPRLKNLCSLYLCFNELDECLGNIFKSSLPTWELKFLELTMNYIGDEALIALLNSTLLKNVKKLYLGHCDLTDRGIRVLLSSELNHLKHLDIRGTYFNDEMVEALINAPYLQNLKTLDISDNREGPEAITQKHIESIIQSPNLSSLKKFIFLPRRIWGKAGVIDIEKFR